MKEKYYDELLSIKTAGEQNGFNDSLHYHRYEPTPYSALELLFKQYELKSNDRIVDFGCGKGRLNFLINYLFDATAVGVEMNEVYYKEALENKDSYMKKHRKATDNIHFQCCLAEEYEINPLDNRFYFFNPFTIQIFRRIVDNILVSVENKERKIELVLYYVSDDYLYFLENHPSFELKEEIKLQGLYEKDSSERFLIYQLSY